MICINLIRISADSKYLDINVETTSEFVLDKLIIDKLNVATGNWEGLDKDFSQYLRTEGVYNPDGSPVYETDEKGNYIFDNTGALVQKQKTCKHQVLRINLEEIFGGSGMFKITMSQKWIGEKGKAPEYEICDSIKEAYVSDVSMVYKYLVGKLMNMNCNCYRLDEDLERNFTFLYAHQEAMALNRIDEAKSFYVALAKTFNFCGPTPRFGNDCICQTKPTQQLHYPNYINKQRPGCGCGR